MTWPRRAPIVWAALGVAAATGTAVVLIPLRGSMRNANVALVLVAVVVLMAVAGGRAAGAGAALASSVAFDLFHTEPYLRLRIALRDDVETTVVLLVVGLVVGQVVVRARRTRDVSETRYIALRRLFRVAEMVARSTDPAEVIKAAQEELVALLELRSCRFEASPFAVVLERLERSPVISPQGHRLTTGGFQLPPEGAELPVNSRGYTLGRFVLDPAPGTGVSLEQRVVATALADQVGAVLSIPRPSKETRD